MSIHHLIYSRKYGSILLKPYAFKISGERGVIALSGCFKRAGTFEKEVVFMTLVVAMGVMGWFGCTGMVFQRTKQVGVFWDKKPVG